MANIEASMDTISNSHNDALVSRAGYLITLPEDEIVAWTVFISIVNERTRCVNRLDRLDTSKPCYEYTKVVVSAIESDHKVVFCLMPVSESSSLGRRKCTCPSGGDHQTSRRRF